MYSLRLFHDTMPANTKAEPVYGQHMILYGLRGTAYINDEAVAADTAKYCEDVAYISSGDEETVVWRFELLPTAAPFCYMSGDGIKSVLKIARRVRMFDLSPEPSGSSAWTASMITLVPPASTPIPVPAFAACSAVSFM